MRGETERGRKEIKEQVGGLNPTVWPGFGWRNPSDIRGDPAEREKKSHFRNGLVNYVPVENV